MRNVLRLFIVALAVWLGAVQLSSDCAAQCSPTLGQGIIAVDPQGTGAGGESWNCAFPTLQAALTAAAQSQGAITEIWVAAGTYTPSLQHDPNHDEPGLCCANDPDCCTNDCDDPLRTKTFQLISNVSMYGGFLGNAPGGGETSKSQADPSTNLTILSGDLSGDGDPEDPGTLDDNAYHVLYYYLEYDGRSQLPDFENWEIDGFVIEGGNANGGSQDVGCENFDKLNAFGGGMLNNVLFYGRFGAVTEPACPRIRRCVFRNNRSTSAGGAYAAVEAGAYFEDCEFRDNLQTEDVNDIIFQQEVQPGGAGASVFGPMRVIKCNFVNNIGHYWGGGLSWVGFTGSDARVVNCDFRGNEAAIGGGVSKLEGGNVHGCITLIDCTFVDGALDTSCERDYASANHDRK